MLLSKICYVLHFKEAFPCIKKSLSSISREASFVVKRASL
ncbi:hypothetical protein HMPREF9969_0578 [Prevotella sp. oral taxon 306 str. F0472]|nr:hypothetical protein HMPREF9969_0578 [Prevotella sp. oral taxon 306 str. F0472]